MSEDTAHPPKAEIPVHFVKSAAFRTIHADGAWGGMTPNGHIQMAFFSERYPIPQQIKCELDEHSRSIKETVTITKSGIVREAEVSVVMPVNVAKAIRRWLDDQISIADRVAGELRSKVEK